ncbi:MAG: DUF6265 family protein [Candidatus Roseilinea sp.]|uniref:DUF6265 family protein n=1 Tax=Candidatus Roseilinea sp. TaxID=2838777 RepID=UPI00404A7D3A
MAQATSPAPLRATIDDLAWLAGSWYGHAGDDPIDEHWSAPAGGVMIGMFRWLKQGRLCMYEVLAIEPEASGGLVLRLKPFHEGLVAWEGGGQESGARLSAGRTGKPAGHVPPRRRVSPQSVHLPAARRHQMIVVEEVGLCRF